MLALPMQTASFGFLPATLLFLLTWLAMLYAAWFLYEVALSCPPGANIMTMAQHTLGKHGKYLCYIAYIALLYLLNAAYLSGISNMINHVFALPTESINAIISITGWVIGSAILLYLGHQTLNRLNMMLVACLIGLFLTLIGLTLPHVQPEHLWVMSPKKAWYALPVIITAFGYQIIIPTLCRLWHTPPASLKKTIFWGSLIPLFFYIFWEMTVLGMLPLQGNNSVGALMNGPHNVTTLLNNINLKVQWPATHLLLSSFTTLAIITSFLGVSMSLFDALRDAFQAFNEKKRHVWLLTLTFFPSLLFTLFYPEAFIVILGYAGIFVAILLAFLPAWMVLIKRKREPQAVQVDTTSQYAPWAVMLFALAVILIECIHPAL